MDLKSLMLAYCHNDDNLETLKMRHSSFRLLVQSYRVHILYEGLSFIEKIELVKTLLNTIGSHSDPYLLSALLVRPFLKEALAVCLSGEVMDQVIVDHVTNASF